ncbi:hypothetical protein SE27_06845 [Acinetobacter harbinensis]|uniref:hypothetical protein n=1 Tax=Acinetobacter harbinensis TaxID=1353941 RepID=UPI00057D4DA4|nr:hypothetical protein [Acinetobacter harbinensis]KWQ04992.1 hypothetical protein SE27_06845 [Acinetobacter harbinensis]
MTLKLTLAALLAASLALTACSKKQDTTSATSAENSAATEKITAEQQAAIDAIDQPVLDEKNTDVAAEIANLPADEATAVAEMPASSAVAP